MDLVPNGLPRATRKVLPAKTKIGVSKSRDTAVQHHTRVAQGLPPSAKRVFKGVIFDVWQWEQKMFDGSVKTFEKVQRPDTADVIAVVGDKILIQLQRQPNSTADFFSLPGGRVDEGEEPLEAAKRELLEEAGYASDTWELWQALKPVNKMVWTIYVHIARNCKKVQEQQLDSGEQIEPRLISFDEFLALADAPNFYDLELKEFLIRAKFDPKAREEFDKLLFGETLQV